MAEEKVKEKKPESKGTVALVRSSQPRPAAPYVELPLYSGRVTTYFFEVPHGDTIEDVVHPQYFKAVWKQLARWRWTELRVIAIDGTWEAALRVVSASEDAVRVRVLSAWQDDVAQRAGLPADWAAEFVTGGWRVRNAHGDIVTDRHGSRGEAIDGALTLKAKLGD